jgi:hypothetical protein
VKVLRYARRATCLLGFGFLRKNVAPHLAPVRRTPCAMKRSARSRFAYCGLERIELELLNSVAALFARLGREWLLAR